MLLKIHNSYRTVIAICDKELLGKTFEEGKREITLNPHFFEGEEKTEQEILQAIENGAYSDSTFNIVGKRSIETALKAGLIKHEGIFKIKDIPIALSLL
jgi:uncharacterized protein